jgi:hypothetical protein
MLRCRDTNANGDSLAAASEPPINLITICPRSFNQFATTAPATKDQDVSATGAFIHHIWPLSALLLHEYLHILYADFSKWFSPISGRTDIR